MKLTSGKHISISKLLPALVTAVILLLATTAFAAAPGIASTAFNITASPDYISQPDGAMIYSWGYGCTNTTGITMNPAMPNANCPLMQVPGPTMVVTEGVAFTVTLTNGLPAAAGNTSILFPGLSITAIDNGVPGLLTTEAAPGASVTYHLMAATPGTRAYYSGTQGDLQVEMGLYGSVVVLPSSANANYPACPNANLSAETANGENDFRLSKNGAAYDHPASCYDREYLFQFSEIDPRIHQQAIDQLAAINACAGAAISGVTCPTTLDVATEPYHPTYYMINGRSMPDDMDTNYAAQYPHQPYNGNPHMHPGENVLLRVVGTGRWQHPFHEHGNHVRILGRDGNLILSATDATKLAGPLLFTTTTTPGLAMDGIFYWTGKGLNWDVYGHHAADANNAAVDPGCTPDSNGYDTSHPAAPNYYEWCADHDKALEKAPFGNVGSGGPVTLPDANIMRNGAWFGGSPYLGPDATIRSTGPNGTTPPSGTIANSPSSEAGFAFMWHSHNEREITTSNAFPGGMLMMMLVDPRAYVIDESF